MRLICLIISLSALITSDVFGKIRNGYESQLAAKKASLRLLNIMLQNEPGISFGRRLEIKSEIGKLVDFISCYELTEQAILQLRDISPGVYFEIDSIRDKKGRPTDIYVRLVPKGKVRVSLTAATFFAQSPLDDDAHVSEYGAGTVAVDICIADNSLFLLAHELGHVKYIVPNFAEYVRFYKRRYGAIDLSYVGHARTDSSGMWATNFERRLLRDREFYILNGGSKFESFVALFNRVRRSAKNSDVLHPLILIASR